MTQAAAAGAPVALVTGGGTGIGAACCRALAAEGFRVAIHYRSSEESATKLAAEKVPIPAAISEIVARLKN